MTPDTVIKAYVSDVARRLPRAKRSDVALELQALLNEELQGKADEQGHVADEAMALELVRTFGSPAEVAERYRPAGFVIIPSTDAYQFIAIAFGGVALQWLITLPVALMTEPGRELVALGTWWVSQGLGALWWPGFMVTATIIGGWTRHTWPQAQTSTWRPHRRDTDDINRTLWMLGFAAAACGIATLVGAQWIFRHLFPPQVATAFAFDPEFLPIGGAMVGMLWSFTGLLYAMVFFEGRWRLLTRRFGLASDAAWFAALCWLTLGPRIYLSPVTDEAAKGWISLVALFVLIDFAVKSYRYLQRPRTAHALAAIAKA